MCQGLTLSQIPKHLFTGIVVIHFWAGCEVVTRAFVSVSDQLSLTLSCVLLCCKPCFCSHNPRGMLLKIRLDPGSHKQLLILLITDITCIPVCNFFWDNIIRHFILYCFKFFLPFFSASFSRTVLNHFSRNTAARAGLFNMHVLSYT